ncbi:trifunctional MMPL family transporter/lysophospholipid acyltransferase/class I SAM-dependent methyltransferase [Dyadobacter fanqingshengii]|uniref:1-acyl-sn-glycerol-3-phosphate acyltransferase n=1 Tax=Dyadobacter fanqingshengii TaxID=2906443 RepID=A0A9X1PAH0_9BACT|nr:trifunctional MMPL family transporter/lysophospholipid acyltransferase/class I SAM-dependent methyltransferase [Dyadobacter fanqingshengii]MCF0041656.1 1-acyl-sn-glycerol-3-phosphate acyltransferase [Dyadobacter fanqingshengii]USJ36628.1 1-acyl-sn-glycerol-3-phosphate acyltransferase [Dyadobacter fanqingshengii]
MSDIHVPLSMIGDLLLRLHKFLSRHKPAFFLSLVALTSVLLLGISRLKVTESIFATLPKGKSFEEFNRLIESKNIINQIVFSIDIPDETTSDDAKLLGEAFSDSLTRYTHGAIRNIQIERPFAQEDVYQFVYGHFPQLIDSSYYSHIGIRLNPDSIKASVNSAYNQLTTPGGTFLKQFILNDPLGLTGPYFRKLNAGSNANGMVLEDGVMFTGDRKKMIIFAATSFDSGNSEKNVALYEDVEAFKSRWNKQQRHHNFSYFGTFEIAARNAIQVKQDSYFTSFVALGCILLLLILYYRKFLIPLYIILPGLFGAIFALGIIGFVRPEISGISLATGAVVFGILLDYAFHFFTHLRHTNSIATAIKEVSEPLLTGSFTTVMAFSALHFANSAVLQDFGLFSSLSLLGAALFTLIALPIILSSFAFDNNRIPEESRAFRFPKIQEKSRPMVLAIIAVLTLIFLYFARFTEFDSGFDNLSIQDDDLQKREEAMTGIDPKSEKRIYIFAANPVRAKAEQMNFQVYQNLVQMREQGRISSFVSSGSFLVPQQLKLERNRRWHQFWDINRKEVTYNVLDQAAAKNGFNATAFSDFKSWIAGQPSGSVPVDTLLSELGLDNLIESNAKGTTFITTLIVQQNKLNSVKNELRAIPGIALFDRGELAGDLLKMVKDDFNYLLLISASIVFLTLLIVYGRIELTLLTFLPMVISWIWILGIAALLGIKFNFVNVIVTTFIFGLGDDFSIFVTDGLLNKYKYGKDSLRSYQSAIALSATTTIIGTGVLIFAKHPAIHSIALISVLGICCILFISFVFQPVLFGFFVQNRIARKKAPVTFLPFLISISSFTYFLSGCLFLHSKLVTILLLPISKLKKKAMLNRSLSFYAKTVIYSGPHVKKNFSGLENLQPEKPVIFIANHTSFLDILLAIMLNPKIVLMVKGWVYNSPFFGPIIRHAGYVYTDDGPEENINKVKTLVEDGYSLLIFPEGTRSENGDIGRFHKGAFHLAEQLNLDIQPILIHGASDVLPKNDFLIRPGALNVRVLPRIRLADAQWGSQLRDKTKNIAAFFKSAFASYQDEMEDTAYLKHKIFTNYVFKGPVLEWYFKIKWRLESKNFAYYNDLIGDRKNILDIGCGYGYLSFYLHYKNAERIITGIDYDQEKISIAQHSYRKTGHLNFIDGDVMQADLGSQDVIFLNDILHYLSKEKQLKLLHRCASALQPDGILFIRDGITDNEEKHRKTKTTEALSTGLFSFNRKEDAFHYFSSADIRDFAAGHKLHFEMQEHSTNTSNVLFILRPMHADLPDNN